MEGYSELTDLNHLYDSYKKSKSGSDWKPSVQIYEQNWLINIVKTRQELEEKTYKPRKGKEFTIRERGKIRHIRSNPFYDRVIRRCFCDYVLEPALYPYLIHDNGASVRGKGIGFTRRRFEQKIHEFYRKNHGNDGYILIIDFKKYYDSIPHDKLLEQVKKHLTDADCIWLIKAILKNFEINGKPISCGIGDQCSQIFGVYFPTIWDTFFKIVKHIRNYDRYMDDSCIVHKSKEFLKSLLKKAILVANKLGIHVNTRKTHIYKLSRGFTFLQIRYRLSKSGHLCKHMNPKRISSFRRRLKKQFVLCIQGRMSFKDVENAFKSWIMSFKKILSKRSLHNLYNLYNEQFIHAFTLYGGVYGREAYDCT